MLNLAKCVLHKTRDLDIVPGTTVNEEGFPLVKTFVNGKEAVMIHDGNTADKPTFIGFSYSESLTPITATNGATITLDDAGKGKVFHPILTGQVSVYEVAIDDETGVVKRGKRIANADVAVDPADARVITVTGQESKKVEVVYAFAPTTLDLQQESRFRVLIPMGSSSSMTGTIGAIIDGEVYTDKVDLSADFTAPEIKFAVNDAGLLTCYTGATAPANSVAIDNMELIEYPNASNPYVGVRFTR